MVISIGVKTLTEKHGVSCASFQIPTKKIPNSSIDQRNAKKLLSILSNEIFRRFDQS